MTRSKISAFLRVMIHIAVLRPFIKLVFGIHITGLHHLRALDRFIVIANHNSHLDIFLLFYVLAGRDIVTTHAVAEETYFSRSRLIFRMVDFLFQPVWIRRGHPDLEGDPLAAIKNILSAGHSLIVFPEGTRGQPGILQPFKSGLGRVVCEYRNVPIVPVFLSGAERVLPKSSAVPLPFWTHIVIGPPQLGVGPHRVITRHLQETLEALSLSASAQRHHRKKKSRKPIPPVAVIGIDGSGKSTVSHRLAQDLSSSGTSCLVSDRLQFFMDGDEKSVQPLALERVRGALGNYAKSAKSMKAYKIPKLAELILRDRLLNELKRWYTPGIIVQDGSPLLNMTAWSTLYKDDRLDDADYARAMAFMAGETDAIGRHDPLFSQLPELRILDRLRLTHLSFPHVVVFIDCPPQTACERIAARGERLQVHETEEKLTHLQAAYQMVCRITTEHRGIPTALIDGSQPLEAVVSQAREFVRIHLQSTDKNNG
jgi:1-acyl-sn-glycerol-3-phosphate acyltransferase